MTRSTLSPVRRFTAALALAGVAGLGGVAVAPAAHADDRDDKKAAVVVETPPPGVVDNSAPLAVALPEITGVKGNVVLPALVSYRSNQLALVQSPTPDAPVTFRVDRFSLTLNPVHAQKAQTALATLYTFHGYPVVFTARGQLVIGPRTCDPTKSGAWNKGCVTPGRGPGSAGGGRF
jgi:hypothetical protein